MSFLFEVAGYSYPATRLVSPKRAKQQSHRMPRRREATQGLIFLSSPSSVTFAKRRALQSSQKMAKVYIDRQRSEGHERTIDPAEGNASG
jgi:hypothetical protein